MIKLLHRLFNLDVIAELEHSNNVYRERVEQLEAEVREYKGYKLKYKVAQMLVDDDPAIDELLEAAQKAEENKQPDHVSIFDIANQSRANQLADLAARQQSLGAQGYGVGLSSLFGIGVR